MGLLFINSISERIEPGQRIGIALPVRRPCGPQFGVHLFQSLSFHLKARLSVMVCGVEMNGVSAVTARKGGFSPVFPGDYESKMDENLVPSPGLSCGHR